MDVSGNDNGRRREVETAEESVGDTKIELKGYHRGESDVEEKAKKKVRGMAKNKVKAKRQVEHTVLRKTYWNIFTG